MERILMRKALSNVLYACAFVKLHAPQHTTIEAVLKNGEVISVKVSPEARAEDVIIFLFE